MDTVYSIHSTTTDQSNIPVSPYQMILDELYNDLINTCVLHTCIKLHKSIHTKSWDNAADHNSNNKTNKPEKPLKCLHCQQKISIVKYAPHLEKCMGKGGRISRRTNNPAGNTIPYISIHNRPPSRQSNHNKLKIESNSNGHINTNPANIDNTNTNSSNNNSQNNLIQHSIHDNDLMIVGDDELFGTNSSTLVSPTNYCNDINTPSQ